MLFVKSAAFLLFLFATLSSQVQSTAIFGIGTRILGDHLIVKDVQQTRPAGVDQSPTIVFTYAVPEPITYIEIRSEDNVSAEVNFSYHHDLVKGTVAATTAASEPFEVLITIYGFNETMLNVNPSLVLNRDQQFEGRLEPMHDYENDEAGLETLEHENEDDDILPKSFDGSTHDDDEHHNEGVEDDENYGDDDDDTEADFENKDHEIELGHRQKGDYLIYETYQTSPVSAVEPTNHSVVFYYIDSNYITCVKFILFDHYVDKPANEEHDTAVGEYSHWSPNSLKAVITDFKTSSLFVKMFLYGYRPADLPSHYEFYLPHHMATELPHLMIAKDEGEALLQHAHAAVQVESVDLCGDNAAAKGGVSIANSLWAAMVVFLFGVHSRI